MTQEEFDQLESQTKQFLGETDKDGIASYSEEISQLFAQWVEQQEDGLNCYVPTPQQLEFHKSDAKERIVIGSNRAGKTLSACAELAMTVTGRHMNGVRYPSLDGVAIIVGLDLLHVATVVWRNLTEPGAFKVVWDDRTCKMRPVFPDDPWDLDHQNEWKQSPPLLPRHMFRHIAWENKAQRIPRLAILRNGWELRFYSSRGEPPQGFKADYAWFDEEIEHSKWYEEVSVRGTFDNSHARFVWSATPQVSAPELFDLNLRGQDPSNPFVHRTKLLVADNPYLAEFDKQIFKSKLRTHEQIRMRWDGEFSLSDRIVYPEFGDSCIVDSFPIPDDWTRYMALDPGRQVCAAIFIAIPPDGNEIHVYDEMYNRNSTAAESAAIVAEKVGQYSFQKFLIDHQMGRQHQMTDGVSIETHYSEAFRKLRISSIESGHGFVWASNNVASRTESLHNWLSGRLKVHRKCANLIREFPEQYYQKRHDGVILDKRMGKNDHAVTCLEYLAASNPVYVKPKGRKKKDNPLQKRKKYWSRIRQEASITGDEYISLS